MANSICDPCFASDSSVWLEHYKKDDGSYLETTIVHDVKNNVWEFSVDELVDNEKDTEEEGWGVRVKLIAMLTKRFGLNWPAVACNRAQVAIKVL